LAKAASLIDLRLHNSPILQKPYGGKERQNIDPIVMLKLLVLQQWYGLSDPELERQVARGVIFQHFLGFLGYWTTRKYGLDLEGEADQ
jgi:IS5 family transposase